MDLFKFVKPQGDLSASPRDLPVEKLIGGAIEGLLDSLRTPMSFIRLA